MANLFVVIITRIPCLRALATYSQWDPTGPYTRNGRPIDEITNSYESEINPDVLVNTGSVPNGYKACIWAGHQAMSEILWTTNGSNISDVEHTKRTITSTSYER